MVVSFQFDDETRLERTGELTFSTTLTNAWNIADNPNGGYLLAPLQRAMGELSGQPDPLTVTTHFLRPGQAGPAEIQVETVRVGRTVSTMRGRLIQDGKVRLESLAAFSDLAESDPVVAIDTPMPDLPPPEECVSRRRLEQGVDLPIMDRVDVRVHPAHSVAGTGRDPVITGWIRFGDDRPVDIAALTLFADAFPPPLFSKVGYIGWVPTIELTVQLRRRPKPGWICGNFVTTDAAGRRTIEDGLLWDQAGNLIAMARQVGLVLS